jgi:hypothetical protein
MATNEELARILRELEALSAEPSRH